MIMNWIKKCPVFALIIISGITFTLIGIIGKNSIYKEYKFDFIKMPFLSLTLEGLGKGDYPWDMIHLDQMVDAVSSSLNLPLDGNEIKASSEESVYPNVENIEDIEDSNTVIVEEQPAVESITTYDFETVTEDYFNDAVFIGDSRTVGLFEYGGIEERADFMSKTSLTIYEVFTSAFLKEEETGEKITIEEALKKKQYGKVYLMLGINELGTGTTETFIKEYEMVVRKLQKLQPDAVIFVEGVMRVAGTKNAEDPIFNNTNINDRNEAIKKLADQKSIFYLDVNEVVCDEEGNLNSDYTTDDIHLKAQYYAIWKQFLLEHGIVRN